MEIQFRSALGGFNRSDVVAFLQTVTENHKNELLALRGELDRSNEAVARLTAENEALRGQVAELLRQQSEPAEPSMQQRELEAYRRAAGLAQEAEEKAAAVVQEAQSHADTITAEAEARVAETAGTLNELIAGAADRFTGDELNDLIAAASQDLEALQARLRNMTDCFRQAADSIRGLQK